MACATKVHMFQYNGIIPKLGIGQPQVFLGCKDEDCVVWAIKLTKRWGGALHPYSKTLTVSSCGTRPWHLGVQSDCANTRALRDLMQASYRSWILMVAHKIAKVSFSFRPKTLEDLGKALAIIT